MSFLLMWALHGMLGQGEPKIASVSPAAFRGGYAFAVSSCDGPGTPDLIIGERTVEWFGRRDRILFSERLSPDAIHFFLDRPGAQPGARELHFALQGNEGSLLLVLDHLSDAEDIIKQGSPIPDKSVIGFYRRCDNAR